MSQFQPISHTIIKMYVNNNTALPQLTLGDKSHVYKV
jgi:hypothetical protein